MPTVSGNFVERKSYSRGGNVPDPVIEILVGLLK